MKLTKKLVAVFALALMMTVGMASPAMAADTATFEVTVAAQQTITVTDNTTATTAAALNTCTPIGGSASWTVTSNVAYDLDAVASVDGGANLAESNLYRNASAISTGATCVTGTPFVAATPQEVATGILPGASGTEHYAVQVGVIAAGSTDFTVTYTVSAAN